MDFDSVVKGGEAILMEAHLLEQQEGLQLDFKVASEPDGNGALFTAEGKFGKDGRRVLGKALSALANSAGGLIVIGVDCRPNADGVDCVSGLRPFSSWRAALSTVNGSVGDLLQPKHDGIRVHAFPSSADPEQGYVAIEVPRSERRPHISQTDKHYYKRAGASSFPMEHYDIEDAFRRTTTPDLEPEIDFRRKMTAGRSSAQYHIEIYLANRSNVTAFFPSLGISWNSNVSVSWPDHVVGVHRERNGASATAYGTSEITIHPGQRRLIDRLQIDVTLDDFAEVSVVGGTGIRHAFIDLDLTISAQDMRTKSESRRLQEADFEKLSWA